MVVGLSRCSRAGGTRICQFVSSTLQHRLMLAQPLLRLSLQCLPAPAEPRTHTTKNTPETKNQPLT